MVPPLWSRPGAGSSYPQWPGPRRLRPCVSATLLGNRGLPRSVPPWGPTAPLPAASRGPRSAPCSLVHFLTWLPFLSAWRLSLQWKLSSQNSANQMLRRLLSSVRLEK